MIKLSLIIFVLALINFSESIAKDPQLTEIMFSLDVALFDSFNKCEDKQELEKHSSYFDPNVEFYHDNGGVTWNRKKMIENTKKFVCGNFTRELVPGTFKAYSIKDYGAITQGEHRFCQSDSNQCEGKADFVMVWRSLNGKWQVTRTLSFGHRSND